MRTINTQNFSYILTMDKIVLDIERVFEQYSIYKMLIICSEKQDIEQLANELKDHHHSVSGVYHRMNNHVIRWNMNRFITNHTRTLVIGSDKVGVLNGIEYDSIWNDINFIVCIDLTEEEKHYWIHRYVQHDKSHYIHIYDKDNDPQYYIMNI